MIASAFACEQAARAFLRWMHRIATCKSSLASCVSKSEPNDKTASPAKFWKLRRRARCLRSHIMTNDGVIVRVRGSVVDVRFQSGELPAIGEALTVKWADGR